MDFRSLLSKARTSRTASRVVMRLNADASVPNQPWTPS